MLRNALFLLFGLFFVAGCAPTFNDNCVSSLDCFSNETCAAGVCELKPNTGTTNNTTNNGEVGPIDSVDILPSSVDVVVGTTTALSAEATDEDGNAVVAAITWASDDASIATVDTTGVVTAVAVGNVKITATTGMISGESIITVLPVTVDKVNITPLTASIITLGTAAFTVEVLGTDGNVMPNPTITWSTTDEAIITVDQNGLVTAVAAGNAQVVALVGTVQGFGDITVDDEGIETIEITPDPATVILGGTGQLTGLAKDVNGNDLTGRVFTWSSSEETVATIDATGLVTGVALGTATITAEAEGKMATVVVTVTNVPVASVEIGPAKTFVLTQDQSLQLTVDAFDAANQPILGRTAMWSSSDVLIATVSSVGEVTFLNTGVVTITVDIEGQTDSAMVTINPSPVVSVDVSAGSMNVIDGMTLQLTAELRDGANNILNGRVTVWTSDDSLIATVDSNGLVTGVTLGSTTIRATSEGIEGSYTVGVVAGPVETVTINPNTATLSAATTTAQLTAVLVDLQGNPVVDVVTWTSTNPAFVTVDNTGLVTRVAVGSVTISAVADGVTGLATVTVTD